MRRAVEGLALALGLALTGCSSSDSGGAEAECAPQVRLDGVVYSGSTYTKVDATKHVPADKADCHDVGSNPAGSVFDANPEQVTTWTFDGYPPEKVLGVRFKNDSFSVFIADSVAADERDRISRALRDPTIEQGGWHGGGG